MGCLIGAAADKGPDLVLDDAAAGVGGVDVLAVADVDAHVAAVGVREDEVSHGKLVDGGLPVAGGADAVHHGRGAVAVLPAVDVADEAGAVEAAGAGGGVDVGASERCIGRGNAAALGDARAGPRAGAAARGAARGRSAGGVPGGAGLTASGTALLLVARRGAVLLLAGRRGALGGLRVLDCLNRGGDVCGLVGLGGAGRLLGKLGLDLGVQGVVVGLGLVHLGLVGVNLALHVLDGALLACLRVLELALLGLKALLGAQDLGDGLRLLARDAVEVVDAADQVLDARGAEDDVDDALGALLVRRPHAVTQLGLEVPKLGRGLVNLGLLVGDGDGGALQGVRCLLQLALHGRELCAERLELCCGSGEVVGGVCDGRRRGKGREGARSRQGKGEPRRDDTMPEVHETFLSAYVSAWGACPSALSYKATLPQTWQRGPRCSVSTQMQRRSRNLNEAVEVHGGVLLGKGLARLQEGELEDEPKAGDGGAAPLDKAGRRKGGATGGHEVVDDKDPVVGREGVDVHLELVCSVLQGVGLREGLARQLSGLAGGHEAGAELERHGGAQHEAAGLGADDLGDAGVPEVVGDVLYQGLEGLGVAEQRRDVLEDDAGLGVVRNAHDLALVVIA